VLLLLAGSAAIAQSEGSATSDSARTTAVDPLAVWREPEQCMVRTCMLALEATTFGYHVVRGIPGRRLGRIGLFGSARLAELAVAMASSARAQEQLGAVRRSVTASAATGPLLLLGGLGVGAAMDANNVKATSAAFVVPLSLVLAGVAVEGWGDLTWLPRLQEAFRVYNAGLPDPPPH
jgi:hypothetical protein